MFAFGGLLLYLTCLTYLSTAEFLRQAVITRGEVIGYEEKMEKHKDGDINKVYRPIIKFQAQGGQIIEVKPLGGDNEKYYKVGEMIKLAYNPNNPTDFKVYDFVNLWIGPVFLGFCAVNILIIGVFLALSFTKW